MTRRVRGALWPVPPAHQLLPASPPAVVAVDVEIGGQSKTVDFMIDSGADFTTLGPVAANELLGEDLYGSLDFSDPQRSLAMHGVGQLATRAFLLDAQIMFRDDQGQRIPIPLVAAVAQPLPSPSEHRRRERRRRLARRQGSIPDLQEVEESDNWWMPNLLGRDILHHFDLHVSYGADSVSLIERPSGG